MTIDFNNINPNRPDGAGRRDAPKAAPADSQSTTSSKDAAAESSNVSVSLSSAAQNLKQLEGEIKSLPDVDLDKVSAIKEKLESGQYTIDAEGLAQKMLDME